MRPSLMVKAIATASATVLFMASCFLNPTKNDDDAGGTATPMTSSEIDSLFALLITRTESLEDIETYEGWAAVDFRSLSTSFGNALKAEPYHVKANVGYVVSTTLALNTSANLRKLADSLDAYFTALDDYFNPEEPALTKKSGAPKRRAVSPGPGLMRKALNSHGVQGLGKALLLQAPEVVLAQTQRPNFPRFLTLNFIQTMVDGEVMPALDSVVSAMARLETVDTANLIIKTSEDTVELDLGDVYIFDAGVHLLRAGLGMFTAYDMDLFTSAADQTYGWIDGLIDAIDTMDNTSVERYSLSGDTLVETYILDMSGLTTYADVYRYNLTRPTFMKIRRENHAKTYADLKAVPVLIKSGIAAIRTESDGQDNDIIPQTDILDMDTDLLGFRDDLIEEGITPALAEKFRTPENLADFITELLNGPYAFNETVDSVTVNLTVNISAWFTNPAQDLKLMWPRYRVLSAAEQVQRYSYEGEVDTSYYTSYFYIYNENYKLNIDQGLIDSIYVDTLWDEVKVYLTTPIHYEMWIDSVIMVSPLTNVDDAGHDYTFDRMMEDIENGSYFPYFQDYTFNGVFVGMTRQKWLDLIYQ